MEISNKILKLDNNIAEAYYSKACAYFSLKDYSNALMELKNAICLFPDNFDYYKLVADIYAINNNYDEAILYYKEIIQNSSPNPKIFVEIAKCFEIINNYVEANTYYLRAYAVASNDVDYILEYADFLIRTNKTSKALSFLKNIIKKYNLNNAENPIKAKYLLIKIDYINSKAKYTKWFYNFLYR